MIYKNSEEVQNNSYINKDFQALWEELLDLIPKFTNKWNPREANESDPLAVLLKLLSIYSDKLNYNIDKSILERFPQTLTELRSAKNVYDTLGYNAPWYRAGSTKITLTYQERVKYPEDAEAGEYITIPRFTMVCDEDSNIVFTLVDKEADHRKFGVDDYKSASTKYRYCEALQGKIQDYSISGVNRITISNLDSNNRLYFTDPHVAYNGIFISNNPRFDIEDKEWKRVDNIYQTTSQYSYQFGVDPVSGACYIEFADTIGNAIGQGLYIKYVVTDGSQGNVKARSIIKFFDENVHPEESSGITINNNIFLINQSAVANGSDPATIEEMYKNYRRVKNTFDTLVTLLDYENYIYRYEKENGTHIVSNIRASDRTNDLFDSYKVWTLDTKQEILKTKVIEDSNNTPKMGANSVKLYPLNPIGSGGISDKRAFENTFKNDTFFDDSGNANLKTFGDLNVDNNTDESIINAIRNAKVVTTDINKLPQNPIVVKYDVGGDIYLNYKVSSYQAEEIQNNVYNALYNNLNSRELGFGEAPQYEKVLDIIKNADDRISYVALRPISYDNSSIEYPAGLTFVDDSDSSNNEAIVKQRAILSGVTPWTNFKEDFIIKANQSAGDFKEYVATDDSDIVITSGVNISADSSDIYYRVEKNENFIAFAPSYRDVTIYANYLYYIYDTESNTTIPADTPVVLAGDQTIKFYETREATQAKYTLGSGKRIKANFELTPTATGTKPSLNDSKQIAVWDYIQGSLGEKDSGIEWITNAEKLIESFSKTTWNTDTDAPYDDSEDNHGAAYTLMTGEYFLFRSIGESGFTILGEGNTVGTTEAYTDTESLENLYESWNNQDWGELIEGYNQEDITWARSDDGSAIRYRQNQIWSFGEGMTLIKDDSDDPFVGDGGTFSLGNSFSYIEKDETEPKDSPAIYQSDKWKAFIRLQYVLGQDGFTLNTYPSSGQYMGHTQYIKMGDSDSSDEYTSTTIQSNIGVESPGGVAVKLSKEFLDSIQEGMSLKIYNYTLDSSIPSSGVYATIPANTPWVVPGSDGTDAAVFGCYSGQNGEFEYSNTSVPIYDGSDTPGTVKYFIARSGQTLTVQESPVNISTIKIAALSETYGWTDDSSDTLTSLFDGSNVPIAKLTEDKLGDAEFNPTHTIDRNSLITDPTKGESFFNKNHPMNRYSLAKLNVDNLKENLAVNKYSMK